MALTNTFILSTDSDWHGYGKPAGFPGKGIPGEGKGDSLVTRPKR